jgi:hypothetical protein
MASASIAPFISSPNPDSWNRSEVVEFRSLQICTELEDQPRISFLRPQRILEQSTSRSRGVQKMNEIPSQVAEPPIITVS